jgi:hypothetical protein
VSLEETLLGELKALRPGMGLTAAKLRDQPTLMAHLGGTTQQALDRLVELIGSISDDAERTAVRYVFSLEGEKTDQAKQRRRAAERVLSLSDRTLIRREIDGLTDLARIIIERSSVLSDQERKDELDYAQSMAKRVADLEGIVAYLLWQLWGSQPTADGKAGQVVQQALVDDWPLTSRQIINLIGRVNPNALGNLAQLGVGNGESQVKTSVQPEEELDDALLDLDMLDAPEVQEDPL